MDSTEVKVLFEKYIKRECSKEEIQYIISYFRTSGDLPDFPTIESVSQLLEQFPDMQPQTADHMFTSIIQSAVRRKRLLGYKKLGVAAVMIFGLLAGAYLVQQNYFSTHKNEVLIPRNESITLELENGNIEVLNEDGNTAVLNKNGQLVGKQHGNQLIYTHKNNQKELVYNTLTVPYGKRFNVQLSDGTIVHLNAGSSLKYPLNFVNAADRKVFLTGEAYFEVAEDKDHPFIVNMEKLNVRVLGTEFNISNYPEDLKTDVVLVEGSVGMYGDNSDFEENRHTVLLPNTKGSFNRYNSGIEVTEVLTSTYTSWVEGRLIFRNMPFNNILRKLERRYNVKFKNTNPDLGTEEFNAGFKDESIHEILEALHTTYGIEYTIENNTVIIK